MTHRAAIDLLVAESNGHFEQISLASEKSLSFDMWIVVSVFVFVICFAVIQGLFVLKRIMTPIKQIQLVIEKMTAGDFSVRTQADSHD
jgi:methyl-accepting chemotaxis protein